MCLLVVAFRLLPDTPLLIGANRDEFLNRPAVPMTVLKDEGPRVLGGKDQQSGGTWLAVNEWGVFAGLTNQPREAGRDATRRTRGELPLALTSATDASTGVGEFLTRYRSSDYNGCWLLTGDRDSLFFIDFTGGTEPEAVALAPGLHILENRALGALSPKAERVAASLSGATDAETALTALRRVLAEHTMADPAGTADPPGMNGPDATDRPRSSANCVHLGEYGTRSSCLIRSAAEGRVQPQIWVADGPPCTAPFVDVSALWSAEPSSPR